MRQNTANDIDLNAIRVIQVDILFLLYLRSAKIIDIGLMAISGSSYGGLY